MAETRYFMSVAKRIWLDGKILEGAGINDGSARRVWKKNVVEEFVAAFGLQEDAEFNGEDGKMTALVSIISCGQRTPLSIVLTRAI